jgi:prepilin-type N-terminal cleavage/methylation domain-containing protein
MKNRQNQAGFTLIELIVGLAISSVAIAAGFGALGIVQDRGSVADEVNRLALSGATQRSMLMDWLASARYEAPTDEVFEGLDSESSGLPMDELLFPTTARTPLSNVSTVVRLYIDSDPETPEVGLVAEMTSTVLSTATRRMEIVPSAAAMAIRYLPEADGTEEWEDGWVARGALPRGVEITLWPGATESLPPLLQLPVLVALPSAR